MNKEAKPETKSSRGWASYVLWAFVTVIVYALSTGPALRLYWKGVLNENLMIIYIPFDWLYDRSPLHKPLGMYWHLWCPLRFDRNGDSIS